MKSRPTHEANVTVLETGFKYNYAFTAFNEADAKTFCIEYFDQKKTTHTIKKLKDSDFE